MGCKCIYGEKKATFTCFCLIRKAQNSHLKSKLLIFPFVFKYKADLNRIGHFKCPGINGEVLRAHPIGKTLALGRTQNMLERRGLSAALGKPRDSFPEELDKVARKSLGFPA